MAAVALLALPGVAEASTITYLTPGTYSVPENCGFNVLKLGGSGTNGYISFELEKDSGLPRRDFWAVRGQQAPLKLKTLTLYSSSPAISVVTTPGCNCGSYALTNAGVPTGCFTQSLNADECEVDPLHPVAADGPGINLGLVDNVGIYNATGFAGTVEFLGWDQSDHGGFWRSAFLNPGELRIPAVGGVRRCRLENGGDTSTNFFLVVKP